MRHDPLCAGIANAGRVYLNDGIYGGLAEFPSIGLPAFRIIGPGGAEKTGAGMLAVV